MTEDLIIHDRTASQIVRLLTQPAHAVLLMGQNGIGKGFLARSLAAQLLNLDQTSLQNYPYLQIIAPEKGSISIDLVRQLQRFLQLKTTGDGPLRRVAIVEHGDNLTLEAQNAFLKILEEPPLDTVLLLTTSTPRSLLPTILSRVQTITVYPPVEATVKEYFKGYGSPVAVDKAYALSGGLPGLMHGILQTDEQHPLVGGVVIAKKLLTLPLDERLAQVDALAKQKEAAGKMVEALLQIARSGIDQAAASGNIKRLKQWHHILKEADEAQASLAANANSKLVLTNLMLQL